MFSCFSCWHITDYPNTKDRVMTMAGKECTFKVHLCPLCGELMYKIKDKGNEQGDNTLVDS